MKPCSLSTTKNKTNIVVSSEKAEWAPHKNVCYNLFLQLCLRKQLNRFGHLFDFKFNFSCNAIWCKNKWKTKRMSMYWIISRHLVSWMRFSIKCIIIFKIPCPPYHERVINEVFLKVMKYMFAKASKQRVQFFPHPACLNTCLSCYRHGSRVAAPVP